MGSLVMAAASFLSFLALWRTYQEHEITTIHHLAMFFVYFGVFQLILGLPLFISGLEPLQVRAFALFAHIFLYIGLAYFGRIAVYIFRPKWEYHIFILNLLIGAAAMYMMLSTWTRAPALIAVPTLGNLVLLGTVPFLYMGVKQQGVDRIKMLAMAVGFLLIAIAGPLHNIASTAQMMGLVEAVTVSGVLVVVGGVYARHLARPED
ncbi:MAG: hypothetical protein SVU32_02095 [Candidatus Nanohaloarchaea archaeon]|nr:hypothetical protein [Candidatus Nanohaloarchaea archaeon]